MYNTLSRLYRTGRIAEKELANAVIKGWITADQKNEIIATK